MDKTLISTVEAPEKSSPHRAGCQFEVEKKYRGLFLSSSLPIKLILYLSRTSGFNESRRKFGMKKNGLREMIFFDISTSPPLSDHLSIRCHHSFIQSCHVAFCGPWFVRLIVTNHTSCPCKQFSYFHFCSPSKSSQDRPRPATTNTHVNSHSPKAHSGNKSPAFVVFIPSARAPGFHIVLLIFICFLNS